MKTNTLSRTQLAAVLAGLRLLQKNMGEARQDEGILDVMTDGGELPLPTEDEIDALCEEINLNGSHQLTVKFRLTLDVAYQDPYQDLPAEHLDGEKPMTEAEVEKTCRDLLHSLVDRVANDGHLIGDTRLVCHDWKFKLERL